MSYLHYSNKVLRVKPVTICNVFDCNIFDCNVLITMFFDGCQIHESWSWSAEVWQIIPLMSVAWWHITSPRIYARVSVPTYYLPTYNTKGAPRFEKLVPGVDFFLKVTVWLTLLCFYPKRPRAKNGNTWVIYIFIAGSWLVEKLQSDWLLNLRVTYSDMSFLASSWSVSESLIMFLTFLESSFTFNLIWWV